MILKTFTPHVGLRKFIKCYYYLENNDNTVITDTFFADGCVEAVISVGWDFYKDGAREDWAKIIGQIIKPRQLNIVGRGQSFGIWFYPHTFSRFANIRMFELNDHTWPWDAFFPKSFAEFVGNCMCERQFDELVMGVDDFLLKKVSAYKEKSTDKLAESAIRHLYENKSLTDLNHLASSLNVSGRYLQKTFLTKVGLSPKQFVRVLRFQQVLQQLGHVDKKTFTQLAYENHFYDQSHFIREFKSYTGLTPSDFELQNLPINQYFITRE